MTAAKRLADSDPILELYIGLSVILNRLGLRRDAIVHFSWSFNAWKNPLPDLIAIGEAYRQESEIDSARSVYKEGIELFGAHSGIDSKAPHHLKRLIESGEPAGSSARNSIAILAMYSDTSLPKNFCQYAQHSGETGPFRLT